MTGPPMSLLAITLAAGRCRSPITQPPMISAAAAPARTPPITAQASAGPASQVAVTGMVPILTSDGTWTNTVERTAAAVTTRSAASSNLIRHVGLVYKGAL